MFAVAMTLGIAARADTASEAYAAAGIAPARVLAGTVIPAQVVPGGDKEVVAVVTYFTGKREKESAVNVRLDVFSRAGGALSSLYTRDFGAEHAGVGGGELQVVDLDGDGVNEVVVSFDSYADPLIEQRIGEVVVYERTGFRTAWAGTLLFDATRAARGIPPERRDRFRREIDVGATLATHGQTLVLSKAMIAVAGERLPEPQRIRETFPLKP